MIAKENNYAFIDSQNLNLSVQDQGWKLDFQRFRVYLKEKYSVTKAYLFIGFVQEHKDMYTFFQEVGYILIFKPTLKYKDGTIKGNCDAELVLQAMIDYGQYGRAVLVTGDGDFYCLVKYLSERDKLKAVIVPNRLKFSALLKLKPCRPYLRFMNNLREKLEYKKEKAP